MENLIKIIGENPAYFKQEIRIDARVNSTLDPRSGWVNGDTTLSTDLDSFEENNNLKKLKKINIIGLINEYLYSLYNNCTQAGIIRPELKANKNYSLTLGIDSENVRIIDKSGFGLFFFNIGEMYKVVFSIFHELKSHFIDDKNNSDADKEILKKVFDSLSLGTTTNQLLTLYSNLLDTSVLSKNKVNTRPTTRKVKK